MEIVRIGDVGVDAAARKAAHVLATGGIVLYPTDTLYGIAVDALNVDALAEVRRMKGRETKKPLSVVVQDVATMERYAVLSARAYELAERFLPGPLTLVLKARPGLPESLLLNGALGVRIPNDPFCLALARAFKKPYTATSANKSGRETPAEVRNIIKQFGSDAYRIALIVDDGPRIGPVASTVVTCVSETPYVLREGALSRTELGL